MAKGDRTLRSSLSSKLLILTICFVMVVEVFVYIPSIAQFRISFLEQRLTSAYIAALSLVELPEQAISAELEDELLSAAGVLSVSLDLDDRRMLMQRRERPSAIESSFDLSDRDPLTLMGDACMALAMGGRRVVRVSGMPQVTNGSRVTIILDEREMFSAMAIYSRNVMLLSIIISIFTAGLVFLSINWLLVRPMRNITRSMVVFGEKPEDASRILKPSGRKDEVGVAERELARMQEELRHALQQQKRLANLGSAVSKVNHDLRNILATAQLSSDRLMMVDDPKVRELSTRLISSIDRAITLCERTLKYGRADEPPPEKRPFPLHDLIEDLRVSLGLVDGDQAVTLDNQVARAFSLTADPDHLFRVMMNLGRNAANAMEATGGRIVITAAEVGDRVEIRVIDTGPGLPQKAVDNLFVPFKGSTGGRGTGLGLAIVAELVEANGGSVRLERTGAEGTVFLIDIPRG